MFREGAITYTALGINKNDIVAISAHNVTNGCFESCCLNVDRILASYIVFGSVQTLNLIDITIFL